MTIDPDHSRPLDVHRWSDHPEIKVLTDGIWMEITEIEGLPAVCTDGLLHEWTQDE